MAVNCLLIIDQIDFQIATPNYKRLTGEMDTHERAKHDKSEPSPDADPTQRKRFPPLDSKALVIAPLQSACKKEQGISRA